MLHSKFGGQKKQHTIYMISFQNLTEKDFQDFLEFSVKDYAEQSIKAGRVLEEESEKWSKGEFDYLLPQGLETPNQFIYNIVLDEKETIGTIWFSGRIEKGDRAFLNNIQIQEKHRGKGYGKLAMMELEAEVKRKGFTEIDLHVYSWNTVAINLYRKLNFEEKSLILRKKLS